MQNNFIQHSQTILICYDKETEQSAIEKAKKLNKEDFKTVTNFFENKSGYIELVKTYKTELK
jgi:hypothetical protein